MKFSSFLLTNKTKQQRNNNVSKISNMAIESHQRWVISLPRNG